MNVFEDLLVDLKEENLLEETVIAVPAPAKAEPAPAVSVPLAEPLKPAKRPSNGSEFYKKRAIAEISTLQMVEHVLTSIEREYLRSTPKTFDDFGAKKALHAFLHVEDSENSEEHTSAEFALLQETEAWEIALSDRDRTIPVSNLRLYCENSSPPLSSQALLSLARFYRNLPYSEDVRAKFDFVITRLFSRQDGSDKRKTLFSHDEIVAHLNTLYSEWSSIALYGANEDESQTMMTALSFEDLAVEAENAGGFDMLIETDFFGRLRQFKESINEMYFAPTVTAASIDANVRVGNAYVELVDRERRKMDAESIGKRYSDLCGDSISDATARTLDLVEILRSRGTLIDAEIEKRTIDEETSAPRAAVEEERLAVPAGQEQRQRERRANSPISVPVEQAEPQDTAAKENLPFFSNLKENAFAMNRWFLGVALALVMASLALYVYSNFIATEPVTPGTDMKQIPLEGRLGEHLKSARMSGDMFYGSVGDSWVGLSKEKRTEFLQRILAAGRDKGYSQVTLMDKSGKNVAYASATRTDVIMP